MQIHCFGKSPGPKTRFRFANQTQLRENCESGLSEVLVEGEGLRDRKLPHQGKAGAVSEAPPHLFGLAEELQTLLEQALAHPGDLYALARHDFVDKGGRSRKASPGP